MLLIGLESSGSLHQCYAGLDFRCSSAQRYFAVSTRRARVTSRLFTRARPWGAPEQTEKRSKPAGCGDAIPSEINLTSAHGLSLGPADLAASRGMKTTRVGGGHPFYGVLADAQEGKDHRAFFQQDLWHYTVARMVDACVAHGIRAFYGPFGDLKDEAGCEAQFRPSDRRMAHR